MKHHKEVPLRLLEPVPEFSLSVRPEPVEGQTESGANLQKSLIRDLIEARIQTLHQQAVRNAFQ